MFKIETERLYIIPLNSMELEECLEGFDEIERTFGLLPTGRKPGDMLKSALGVRLKRVKENPKNYMWYTDWWIVLKEENRRIGSVMIKGQPNDNGEVIVGYGIEEDYQRRGYMPEALNGLVGWIFENPSAKCLVADTLKTNIPSHRVLEKIGAVNYKENDELFWWKLEKKA